MSRIPNTDCLCAACSPGVDGWGPAVYHHVDHAFKTIICVQLAPRVSTGEDQRYITTPTTLSKNMITNASFRYVFRWPYDQLIILSCYLEAVFRFGFRSKRAKIVPWQRKKWGNFIFKERFFGLRPLMEPELLGSGLRKRKWRVLI